MSKRTRGLDLDLLPRRSDRLMNKSAIERCLRLEQQSTALPKPTSDSGTAVFGADVFGADSYTFCPDKDPVEWDKYAIEKESALRLQQQSMVFLNPTSDSGTAVFGAYSYCFSDEDPVERATRARMRRRDEVEDFRRCYTHGPRNDKKTCVWSSNTCSWLDKSSGITWVAVHGTNSICVVTRDDKLDRKRAFDFKFTSDIDVLQRFRQSIAFEVEDLAYPSTGSRRLSDLDQIVKPFGVVSVLPSTGTDEGSSVDFDEEKAINYLEEMMRSGKDFSPIPTIHTAIIAFQLLLRRRKLKEKEIQVCTWEGNNHARQLSIKVIKEHLSAIYEQING